MYLRELKDADAAPMLAWMHDPDVVGGLNANFMAKTLEDCQAFIRQSADTQHDLHLAIADDDDTYMGTVSLKHINRQTGSAEFAITVRKEAMGRGFSGFGMQAILRKALQEMGLRTVYWCVRLDNQRAVRFYDKQGFQRIPAAPAEADPELAAQEGMAWYAVQEDYFHGN